VIRRLGILGTFVWDTIRTLEDQARGRAFESWGGVTFSLASAAATRPEGWEIVPIAYVGEDLVDRVHELLDSVDGVGSRAGIVAVPEPNNRVELVYTDPHHRGETMRGGVRGWIWPDLAPHLKGLHALYVNFLSGWEMDLRTAQRLRRLGIPIYADLHSLFLGPPRTDGPREPRVLPRWGEWLRCFDAVQMNEHEHALLTGQPLNLDATLSRLSGYGPGAAFVTLGADGAAWVCEDGFLARSGPMRRLAMGKTPASPLAAPGGDPTGAGDAWGAAVFCGLLGGMEPGDAVARANAVAAVKMAHRGGTGLYEHLVALRGDWGVVSPG
jgi:sugar/nucleoside kinase (ribokinase family)